MSNCPSESHHTHFLLKYWETSGRFATETTQTSKRNTCHTRSSCLKKDKRPQDMPHTYNPPNQTKDGHHVTHVQMAHQRTGHNSCRSRSNRPIKVETHTMSHTYESPVKTQDAPLATHSRIAYSLVHRLRTKAEQRQHAERNNLPQIPDSRQDTTHCT